MKEPAFLARLRASAASTERQPDRYIAPRNRKTAVEDGDDTPQYVLEDGSVIGKEEFARLERGEERGSKEKEEEEGDSAGSMKKGGEEEVPAVSSVTDVGGKRKRKAAKIVGGDGEDDDPAKDKPREEGKKNATGKRKQRVKLSFEDE